MNPNVETPPTPSLWSLLAGWSAPVDRSVYLTAGVVLMALKFTLDAVLVKLTAGVWLTPLFYLAPLGSFRLEVLVPGPNWLPVALMMTTFPFAWIGASMSVRRARDAGLQPLVGLLFFVPFVNFLAMLLLAGLPTRAVDEPVVEDGGDVSPSGAHAAIVGVLIGSLLAIPITVWSTLVLGEYGATLFVSQPFLIAAVSGFFYNRHARRSGWATGLIGLLTQLVSAGFLLLFAVEGLICLLMAAPICGPIGVVGALLGRELASIQLGRAAVAPALALPLVGALEPQLPTNEPHAVSTVVEIDAPAEEVWKNVIAFSDIPVTDQLSWYFEAGVAYPVRARLEGTGVGAIRHCEFSTGAFVEPITVWDPPHRLAFDVTEQPAPMAELSFWSTVNAPHLFDGTLQSRRGEFLLERLDDGRTRLTGTTWYTLEMAPLSYWQVWSDGLIHDIHQRVLEHIRSETMRG